MGFQPITELYNDMSDYHSLHYYAYMSNALYNGTIRYDSGYLTCSKKLMCSLRFDCRATTRQ